MTKKCDPKELAEEALNAACLLIQNRIGVKDGDLAAVVFSDNTVRVCLEDYIEQEQKEQAAEPIMGAPIYFDMNALDEPVISIDTCDFAVHDPFESSCGRFEVEPEQEYGIPDDLARAMGIINMHLRNGTIVIGEKK